MPLTNLMYKGIHFDSDEEVFVAMWAEEMLHHGMVAVWRKVTEPIPLTAGLKLDYTKVTKLKTKIKKEIKKQTILRPSEYTPDFRIFFTKEGEKRFLTEVKYHTSNIQLKPKSIFYTAHPSQEIAVIEVKPSFDQNNMERLFVDKQKYLWDKYYFFVNLVEPMELFRKTFLPSLAVPYFKYKKSPTGKNKGKKGPGDWKMDWIPKTINEFLNEK